MISYRTNESFWNVKRCFSENFPHLGIIKNSLKLSSADSLFSPAAAAASFAAVSYLERIDIQCKDDCRNGKERRQININ